MFQQWKFGLKESKYQINFHAGDDWNQHQCVRWFYVDVSYRDMYELIFLLHGFVTDVQVIRFNS